MTGLSDTATVREALASFYDQVPYDSQPFSEARPAYLGALGRLHGLNCALPTNCRVLELGCASGGHLIPLASYHPQAEFVGIDLSERQINAGRELIQAVGLDNCTLHVADLTTFKPSAEGYDYVIAHGLYSWVPDSVRNKILTHCRRALRPGGIAYISYNTLPGWRMRGLTRDLLEWHLNDIADPLDRLMEAQALISRLGTAVDPDEPSSYLEMELARISSRPPSYLAHEFLEPDNHAFLLKDFVQDAANAGLRYLCNADLATGYPELYDELGVAMHELANDPVELEQYLDFVANRAFRQSLLCRDDEPPTTFDHNRIRQLHLASDLLPPPKLDLRRTKSQTFCTRSGSDFDADHPLTKAVLSELAGESPLGKPCTELLRKASERVHAQGNETDSEDYDEAIDELFSLVVLQHIEPLYQVARQMPHRTDNPRANRLALQQARLNWSHLATITHRSLDIDDFARALVLLLDGTRDQGTLNKLMLDWVKSKNTLDEATLQGMHKNVEENVARLLKLFARHGILEPRG